MSNCSKQSCDNIDVGAWVPTNAWVIPANDEDDIFKANNGLYLGAWINTVNNEVEVDYVDNTENYILRGFRFFHNNLNGFNHSPLDLKKESQHDTKQHEKQMNNQRKTSRDMPSVRQIAEHLRRQKVTYEMMVHMFCSHFVDKYYEMCYDDSNLNNLCEKRWEMQYQVNNLIHFMENVSQHPFTTLKEDV